MGTRRDLTGAERIECLRKGRPNMISTEGNFPMAMQNGYISGKWTIGNWYKKANDYKGSFPHDVLERLLIMYPDCINRSLHLFSGTLKDDPDRVITWDIKPEILVNSTTGEKVKPTICDDIRNIKKQKYRDMIRSRRLIICDRPYNGHHVDYGTPKFDHRQVIRDLEEIMMPGQYLAWLDNIKPMYRRDDLQVVADIDVTISTECNIRKWMVWRRR